ncbi:MAG TPA: hypothetical protein VIH90_00600 [Candidatus Saccharimonadales bacterium]
MVQTETLNLDAAIQAWQVAEFPLIPEEEGQHYTSVVNRPEHGRESLLPVSLFTPTEYDLADVHNAVHEIKDVWLWEAHVHSILQSNLGKTQGTRFSTHILSELLIIAANQHKATTSFSAARFLVGAEAEQETVVSLWDNGQEYPTSEALKLAFSEDQYGDLKGSTSGKVSAEAPWPTLVVKNVLGALDGRLSILSGDLRTEVTKVDDEFTFTAVPSEPITGNLVIAHLPHQLQSA